MTTRIAVIDHGAGNLVSIARGLERAGAIAVVCETPEEIEGADGIVLPGVGATASVMAGIRVAGFESPLRQTTRPVLGICVGMQVLFETSEEDGAACLGLIEGTVRKLENPPRLPHIGWNDLDLVRDDPLFAGLSDRPVVYFVHSYAPEPLDPAVIVARSSYESPFPAVVRKGHVVGTQFHPERSGETGLGMLANFVRECSIAMANR
ncbi:MAG: imidazole glycerol phosphate synthase subunit HisH [Acidimicrobiia bacterium]|nr:imidazole glycerol phosphate synthase subunit HisH [Acidimicrobiia bacterium]MDH4309335.1 imidazole glycerol phosphate synthase subunit HisH [Acidimicrobiia bacterium]